ncbi:MAG: succinylglutamate desuccinylase/aspartoacylase family protein [Armatimonadetes bacterium]|nr:succinylglutamate desuccinylase/aspartoacylase family protein [Armatimonadota bacterium]
MAGDLVVQAVRTAPGTRATGYLAVAGGDPSLKATLVLINGARAGPTLGLLGGIHGAEYTSIEAARRLAMEIDPATLRGRVIAAPIVNLPAFEARAAFVNPQDNKNLNRVFPGRPDGTPSERLAWTVFREIIEPADAVIDLHGGDLFEVLSPFAIHSTQGTPEVNGRSRELAAALGLPVVAPGGTPGSAYEEAARLGKVAVIAEAGDMGRLDPRWVDALVAGVTNAMRLLGMLDGAVVNTPGQRRVRQAHRKRASRAGLWYRAVEAGQRVAAGQAIGTFCDHFGQPLEIVTAPADGMVLWVASSLYLPPDAALMNLVELE